MWFFSTRFYTLVKFFSVPTQVWALFIRTFVSFNIMMGHKHPLLVFTPITVLVVRRNLKIALVIRDYFCRNECNCKEMLLRRWKHNCLFHKIFVNKNRHSSTFSITELISMTACIIPSSFVSSGGIALIKLIISHNFLVERWHLMK